MGEQRGLAPLLTVDLAPVTVELNLRESGARFPCKWSSVLEIYTYREAEAVVEQYNRDLAEWERQVKQKSRPPRPPEKESVRNRLRQLQEQGRQQKPRKKSFDRGSR